MNDPSSIGPTLRRLRTEQDIALATVADQAGISIATLSRIETNKQSIDVTLLLTLTRILGVSAADVLGNQNEQEAVDVLTRRVAALPAPDRTKLFLQSSRQRKAKDLQPVLDDLVATVDLLREELLGVQRVMRKRRSR